MLTVWNYDQTHKDIVYLQRKCEREGKGRCYSLVDCSTGSVMKMFLHSDGTLENYRVNC